jgi:hypothetical protein
MKAVDRLAYRWIVVRKRILGRRYFLLTSRHQLAQGVQPNLVIILPWSLCSMRRNKQPGTPQWIVSAMRYVIQNFLRHLNESRLESLHSGVYFRSKRLDGEDTRGNSLLNSRSKSKMAGHWPSAQYAAQSTPNINKRRQACACSETG